MEDIKDNPNYELKQLITCPACGMLLPINKTICPECSTNLVYEVPKEFEDYSFEKMYRYFHVYIDKFENFILGTSDTLQKFDYNGAYTKLIKETINNPNDENKNKILIISEYFERMNRVLYEMDINWELLNKDENFNNAISHISIIANRENCLRPILYPNNEDLDFSDCYEFIEEHNRFKRFDIIEEETSQIEETYINEVNKKSKKILQDKMPKITAKQYYIAWSILKSVTQIDKFKHVTKKEMEDIGSTFSKGKIAGNTFYKQVALVKDLDDIISNTSKLESYFGNEWKKTIIDLCDKTIKVRDYLDNL